MTEYICMYCRAGRDSECDERACTCCFGVPAELTPEVTVICSYNYQAAKNFAGRRRWPLHSWVYADTRRLRGSEVHRVVHLDGFWRRRDAIEVTALVRQRLAMSARPAVTAAKETAT